ncbi:MAG: hypothetical protein ACFFDN_47560 [Candidatus Hodarchaeota archaeon]
MTFNLEYIWRDFLIDTTSKLTGYMGFMTPTWIISICTMAAGFILGIYCLYVIMKKYRATEDINTLIFFLAGIFLLFSVGLLGFITFINPTSDPSELFVSLAIIAFISTGTCMLLIDIFAFRFTYPERVKTLFVFVFILLAIFIGILIWMTIEGPPSLMYHPTLLILSYFTLIPVMAIGPITFFYYAAKIRQEDRAKSNFALTFGIGIVLAVIMIFNELSMISIEPMLRAIIRLSGIAFVIIFIIAWKFPDWYKRMIGWPD